MVELPGVEAPIRLSLDGVGSTRTFFKYRTFDERTRDIILKSRVYFSSPLKFNDPFDTHLPILGDLSGQALFEANRGIDATPKRKRKEVPKGVDEIYGRYSIEDSLRLRLSEACDWRRTEGDDEMCIITRMAIDEMGIFSASAVPDNVLMYSHYAGQHTGMVLMFQAGLAEEPFEECFQVRYSDERPVVLPANAVDLLTVKSRDWQYEKEIRFVKHREGLYKFDPPTLCGIMLGCEISDKHRKEVLRWAKKSPSEPAVWQAYKHPSKFCVIFDRIMYELG